MPLTLDQYAAYLDTRDLPWPAAPVADPPKARPHLVRLPGVRAVAWNVYGTLLNLAPAGELLFQHPKEFINEMALEKTIHEFKMWNSMSRKPGQPSAYMREVYEKVVAEQLIASGGEKYPETSADRVWEAIVKKLFQKDYKFDAAFFGSLNEFSKKVAYFFHASLQGCAAYAGAAEAVNAVSAASLAQGLLADAQVFTSTQLQRALKQQDEAFLLDATVPAKFRVLSHEKRMRKPSEALFRHALQQFTAAGIEPGEILHVGSSLARDLGPAKRVGMRTALFAGDRASLDATPDQLKDPAYRPDVLLTELPQIAEVVRG